MAEKKLVQSLMDAATITGLAAGYDWLARKNVKESMTAVPSSNVMNYAKFQAVIAGSIATKRYLEEQKPLLVFERAPRPEVPLAVGTEVYIAVNEEDLQQKGRCFQLTRDGRARRILS